MHKRWEGAGAGVLLEWGYEPVRHGLEDLSEIGCLVRRDSAPEWCIRAGHGPGMERTLPPQQEMLHILGWSLPSYLIVATCFGELEKMPMRQRQESVLWTKSPFFRKQEKLTETGKEGDYEWHKHLPLKPR